MAHIVRDIARRVAGKNVGIDRNLLLEIAAIDLLRANASLNLRHLGERDHWSLATSRVDRAARHDDLCHVGGRGAHRIRIHDNHVVLETLRILPSRGSLAGEKRREGIADGRDSETSAPCLLSIDAHVELGNVSFVARVGLRHTRHALHCIQHPRCCELETRNLRPLNVDLDRRTAPSEDRRLVSSHRWLRTRNPAKLRAQIVLQIEDRSLPL